MTLPDWPPPAFSRRTVSANASGIVDGGAALSSAQRARGSPKPTAACSAGRSVDPRNGDRRRRPSGLLSEPRFSGRSTAEVNGRAVLAVSDSS
jgi:hypothetical protein